MLWPDWRPRQTVLLNFSVILDAIVDLTPPPGVWYNTYRLLNEKEVSGPMQDERKQDVLKRLAYIEGHVSGIRRMVDEDKYCIDILRQTHAVRKALEKLEAMILEGHLRTCVPEGIKGDREEEVIQELIQLYTIAGNQ